jgi:3-dehydroquinate synthase
MKKVSVNLKDRSYDILIGSGALKKLPEFIKSMKFNGPIVVVSDTIVKAKVFKILAPVLKKVKNEISYVTVPSSEKSKSIKVYQDSIQKIVKNTKRHRPLIIAFGGGVVGDLTGFMAATYRRGVPFIQIPTTLLAQVDSSVGGKVGIDLVEAKNLVGSFYQPKLVIIDPAFLLTLPKRQIRNGLAEVIKYSLIKDKKFFEFLKNNIKNIIAVKKGVLEKVVYECVRIKARVVEADEFDEKNIRIILNFGHTLGHAIETASGYSNNYNHGESIALGMLLAYEIAIRLDMVTKEDFDKVKNIIKETGLPLKFKGICIKDVLKSYKYDKKFTSGVNRFVLPSKIGSVEIIEDIPELLIKTVLNEYAGY